jgi:hypothetical protein
LISRSSSVRPTNGGSSPSARPMPPRRPTTRTARHAETAPSFPLSVRGPTTAKTIACAAARYVSSPTSTVPGSAAVCRRDAVLTRSPVTMPCETAPTVTAAWPVMTPARASRTTPLSRPSAPTPATSSSAARTARSASSSWAVGVPHTAITASPMNFSTSPPCRSTICLAASKYLDRSSRTSSASRCSESVVKPTRSANRTDTRRRSVAGPVPLGATAAGGASGRASALRGEPHSPQNLLSGVFGAEHDGQTSASGAPHSLQNFRPRSFSVPQLGQRITDPSPARRVPRDPRPREAGRYPRSRPPGDASGGGPQAIPRGGRATLLGRTHGPQGRGQRSADVRRQTGHAG